ncbi:MAG TPA: hypothetical protein PKX38_05125 [Alphaproteobacteria bacterium]|jgi:hypothetical protein|nr:hypothetical protein [Micavibrio sp.]MBK9562960.1 hypothetical protein [Micavibrio sp.]HQX27303.1 hypothetical protein [Alphaproteobacteria bacterium]
MKHVSKILAFLVVNAAGFMSVPLCFILVTKLGLLTMPREDLELEAFKTQFMHGTYMTWLACAVFSVAYFFIKGKERLFFLWAPLVVPVSYGLYVLFTRFSS